MSTLRAHREYFLLNCTQTHAHIHTQLIINHHQERVEDLPLALAPPLLTHSTHARDVVATAAAATVSETDDPSHAPRLRIMSLVQMTLFSSSSSHLRTTPRTPFYTVTILSTNSVTILSTNSVTILSTNSVTILSTNSVTILSTNSVTILSTNSVTILSTNSVTILSTNSVTILLKNSNQSH